jgi:hypothetical protein
LTFLLTKKECWFAIFVWEIITKRIVRKIFFSASNAVRQTILLAPVGQNQISFAISAQKLGIKKRFANLSLAN